MTNTVGCSPMNITGRILIVALLYSIQYASANAHGTAIGGPRTALAGHHDKIVVCYLSAWAVYRPLRGSFAIENLDPSLCTHIVYAFAGLDFERDTIKSLDEWQDLKDNYGKGGYERIVALKNRYAHLKVTLAIGGWNEGSANYSRMASDAGRRKRFVKNASEFVRKYRFDGLDLDWEYPTQRGGAPGDRANFATLVQELHTEFQPHKLLLTSAIGASSRVIDSAYDVPQLSRYLDFMHIMCYDYGGAWDRRVTANAPLYGDDDLNVHATVQKLLALGASPAKIVLGVPFYGRTFVSPATNSGHDGGHVGGGRMGDPASNVGFQGPYTKEDGFIGYNELCVRLSNSSGSDTAPNDAVAGGWQREYDAAAHQGVARWLNESATADGGRHSEWNVVTFDSMRTLAAKARYAVRNQLAGVMVWSVDTDDFLGDCPLDADLYADFPRMGRDRTRGHFRNFPMLRTLNEAIVLAVDELREDGEDGENDVAQNEIPHGDGGSGVDRTTGTISVRISALTVLAMWLHAGI